MNIQNKSAEHTPQMKMVWWYWPALILGLSTVVSVIIWSIAL
jgi:hypothetical protein